MGRPVLSARRTRVAASAQLTNYQTSRRQFINWLVASLEGRGHKLPRYWNYGHLKRAVSDALSQPANTDGR